MDTKLTKKIGVIYIEEYGYSGFQSKTLIEIFDSIEEGKKWIESNSFKRECDLTRKFVGFIEIKILV